LILGVKWLDYRAQDKIPGAKQFVNAIKEADENGKAPTAIEAKPTSETENIRHQDNITSNINLSSRSNEEAEINAKKINAHLGGLLRGKGKVFIAAGLVENVNSYLLAAISIHETGNGTSKVLKDKNNVAGMMVNGIRFRSFNSIDESIFSLAKLLHENYISQGRIDLESIGAKFCPVGAKNDPTNINRHWIPNIERIYVQITGGAI
jgi:beta-N-acetylglucosaminidase